MIPLGREPFMEGSGGGLRNNSPQAPPHHPLPPLAVLGLTFAPLLDIGVCRAGHGRIKAKALTEAQSSLD